MKSNKRERLRRVRAQSLRLRSPPRGATWRQYRGNKKSFCSVSHEGVVLNSNRRIARVWPMASLRDWGMCDDVRMGSFNIFMIDGSGSGMSNGVQRIGCGGKGSGVGCAFEDEEPLQPV